MKKFIRDLFAFLLIILLPLCIGYLYYDPFKVLYKYNDYSLPYVIPNRDYISTEMFIKNKNKYKYNSFIFGSSRTLAFKCSSWSKYLSSNARPFMFDASNESIYGIYTKIKYLNSEHIKIDNALIVICRDATFSLSKNSDDFLFIKHPITSNESLWHFHQKFFSAYLNPKFLCSFYAYTFTHQYKKWMKGYIENRTIIWDTITNEGRIVDQEEEIRKTPTEYYLKRESLFYAREGERIDTLQIIDSLQVNMLEQIYQILKANNSNYKVIISPLYEQVKFSGKDIAIMQRVFAENLFDFSGNNVFTTSKYNYYEASHYRPWVGDSILSIIYTTPSANN